MSNIPQGKTASPHGETRGHELNAAQQERVAEALRSESAAERAAATATDGTTAAGKGSRGLPKAALAGGGSLVACALVAGGLWFTTSNAPEDATARTEEVAAPNEDAVEALEDSPARTEDVAETADEDAIEPPADAEAGDEPNPGSDTSDISDTSTTEDDSEGEAVSSEIATEDSADPVDDSPGVLANTDALLDDNEALYRDGKLYLAGPIQSQERIDYIVDLATPLLGEGNVINEYFVDPSATTQSNGAVRIDDPLLFSSSSTDINPELQEILDLGVTVMTFFPDVTMQVVGHTDDVGPDDGNQILSEARAQAVVEYMVGKGIAPDRFDAFGLGDTQPVADNGTEEGRAENRRIDVALLDLLADAPTN